jgi:hypothetical protein
MRDVTFVVGTGRCGSTALSRIIRAHPDILSLNELCSSLLEPKAAFPPESMTGEAFWRLLSEPDERFNQLISSGVQMEEMLYPRMRERGRYAAETTGIPKLSLMVLPHLTDDPDGLLDELGASVVTWPRRPAPEQHEALFELLADRFGKRVVVERSGFSLRWVRWLREAFPRARFVHLHRNGPDCAVSMSRHAGFRVIALAQQALALAGVNDREELTERHLAALPPHLAALFGDRVDPDLIREARLPVAQFGAMWSGMIVEGVADLAEVPDGQRMTLSYEALLEDPGRELTRLAAFVRVDAPEEWLRAGRRVLDPGRRDLARQLPRGERAELEEACAPGRRALSGQGRGGA